MKATAKGNIKYNGVWYHAGNVIDIEPKDIPSFGNLIEIEKMEEKVVAVENEKTKPAEIKKPKAKYKG